jgi:hypothetical protein
MRLANYGKSGMQYKHKTLLKKTCVNRPEASDSERQCFEKR